MLEVRPRKLGRTGLGSGIDKDRSEAAKQIGRDGTSDLIP